MGFRISWVVFQIPKPRIPDSISKIFLDYVIRIPLHGVIARFSLVVYRVIFREIRLESKWKTTFWVFPKKISEINGTSEKVVLFFRVEYSKWKFVFHFLEAILDTSFRPSRPFFGKWNWFVLMVLMVNAIEGTKFTSPELCEPFTHTMNRLVCKQPLTPMC